MTKPFAGLFDLGAGFRNFGHLAEMSDCKVSVKST